MTKFETTLAAVGGVAGIKECLAVGNDAPLQMVLGAAQDDAKLVPQFGANGHDTKYGCIIAEKKQFHPQEPLFILRSIDRLASTAVREYAHMAMHAGCDTAFFSNCHDCAARMEAWQRANPTLLKTRPD